MAAVHLMYYVTNDNLVKTEWIQRYWKGTFNLCGTPTMTARPPRAIGFDTPREAYEAAGQYECMEDYWVCSRE